MTCRLTLPCLAVPIFALVVLCTGPAFAKFALPPAAYWEFCAAHPHLCHDNGQAFEITRARVQELRKVNVMLNAAIHYRREREDAWRVVWNVGDCDDYAVTKMHMLHRLGWPVRLLRPALVRVGDTPHMVLTIGTLVLDSLRDELASLSDYDVIMRRTEDPMAWVR